MKLEFLLFLASLLPIALSEPNGSTRQPMFDPICDQISRTISSASDVYYNGWPLRRRKSGDGGKGVYHWASSSAQVPKCVVEPGSAADVGTVLRILGSTRTSFAVKGGGHATNPGFSSTTGVHISMYRFSDVVYDPKSQTAEIGAGLIWDDVYAALDPHSVNVLGGRVTGIGVAGFILGGGYSWKTNQHGMAIDTVTAFELVKPNGDVAAITQVSDPDLFFGLKGGFNNFGIVTKFTLRTFPQTQVWGGTITIAANGIPEITAATGKFSHDVLDPKAAIITTYNSVHGVIVITQTLFYDAPSPPAGIFEDFLAVPYLVKDVGTRSFLSLVQSSPSNTTAGQRGIFNTVSLLSYTPKILAAVLNESLYWGIAPSLATATVLSYSVEPFLPSIYSHNMVGSTAFPPLRSLGLLPLGIFYAWPLAPFDDDFHHAARLSASHLHNVAVSEGQTNLVGAPVYPNYAIYDTPLEAIYGGNLPKLMELKAVVDPSNVMGLAGGFKF